MRQWRDDCDVGGDVWGVGVGWSGVVAPMDLPSDDAGCFPTR
jgi:hypothetical protein